MDTLSNKALYKVELYLLKIIPMIVAGLYLANTILSYFSIDIPLFSVIGGMSLLPLIFLYVSSYVFKFCEYHRMFLHYIVVCDTTAYIEYYTGGILSDRDYLLLHIIIAGLFLYIILYLKFRK